MQTMYHAHRIKKYGYYEHIEGWPLKKSFTGKKLRIKFEFKDVPILFVFADPQSFQVSEPI